MSTILHLPNFDIAADAPISNLCRQKGLNSFHEVAEHVLHLPYQRNTTKEDLRLVFTEERGVCSTKHAALAAVALENSVDDLKLIIGIYEMSEDNTPGVGQVLKKYQLSYIPEAHTYLRFENIRIDLTRVVETAVSPFLSLLSEQEISPSQIGDHKVASHRDFLKIWIAESRSKYSLEQVWEVREACIAALSN